jgi:uncharacterized glyoxalase superfamily protein PhnB
MSRFCLGILAHGVGMLSISKIVPVLQVAQMQEALDFYAGVLGFDVCWNKANDGGGDNAMLQAGEANVLLSTGSHLGKKPEFTGTLYFNMEGVQEFFDKIKGRVEVVWPLETMEYGQKEFGIRDCNGYTLAFAESLDETE